MFSKSNLGSAKSSSSSRRIEGRQYICAICSKTFPSSQALAGHSNLHRPRNSRKRHVQESNDARNVIPAFTEPDDSQRPLSPSPLNYRLAKDEQHIIRPFTEHFDMADVYPAPAASPTRGSGSRPFPGQAGGSSDV